MLGNRLSVAAAALVLACTAVFVTAACSGGGKGVPEAGESSKKEKKGGRFAPSEEAESDVGISKAGFEDHKTWGKNSYVFHWKITNSTEKPASYFVSVEFLDKKGDVIGNTGVAVDQLAPGKSEQGTGSPSEANMSGGEVSDISSTRIAKVYRLGDLRKYGAESRSPAE